MLHSLLSPSAYSPEFALAWVRLSAPPCQPRTGTRSTRRDCACPLLPFHVARRCTSPSRSKRPSVRASGRTITMNSAAVSGPSALRIEREPPVKKDKDGYEECTNDHTDAGQHGGFSWGGVGERSARGSRIRLDAAGTRAHPTGQW